MLGKLDSIKISGSPKTDWSKGRWVYKNGTDAGDHRKVWLPAKKSKR